MSSPASSSLAATVPVAAELVLWGLFTSEGRCADFHAVDPRLLWRPVDELLGRHYREVMPAALAMEFESTWEQLAARGTAQVLPCELPFEEGPRKIVATLTRGIGGQVLVMVRLWTPTPDCKLEAGPDSGHLQAVAAAGLGAWGWSAPTNQLWRDERLLQIYGVSQLGDDVASWAAMIHPDDRVAAVHRAESALTDPACHGYDHCYRIVRPDGVVRWLRTQAVLQRDAVGRVQRVVGVDADCTAEQERNEQLRLVSDRLRLAAEAADFGVWDWDVVRDQVVWDARMCALYRVPESDSKSIADLWAQRVHPDDLLRVKAEVRAVLAQGNRLDTEFRIVWPDGTVRHLKDDALVQRDTTGRALRIIGMNRDVTALRRREAELVRAHEAAESASQAKTAFLATISHELRTPLNGILGFASLLADTRLPPEQAEYVGYISHSSEQLLILINDLLDLSSIEGGKLVFEPRPFNLRELIESVVRLLGPRAAEKSLRVSSRWHAAVPATFCGDAARVRQILTNLLGNAIKFTLSGSVTVEVAPDLAGSIRVSVTDTGIGIPSDRQESLFQKFVQADSSAARRFGGSGLGLAISKHLVELMGGKIGLTSQPGRGSTFWFTLQSAPSVAGPS